MRSLIRPQLLLLLSSLSLFSPAWLSVSAQTAADFFHGGAQRYLTNNIPGALEVVTNGLQRFPKDEQLQKLHELLNRQQQQQQQNQQQKEQQEQQQDQQKQDDHKNQQAKNDEQKKDEEQKQKESQNKKDQQKKDQQQDKSGDKSKDKPEEKKESGEPEQVAAHQMTPQEAKQLLDAQKDDEQVLIFQPQGEPKNRPKQLKDW
jgi:Ca-activated chloride channel family protein